MPRLFPKHFRQGCIALAVFLTACAGLPESRPETLGASSANRTLTEEVFARARFRDLKITGDITLAVDDRPVVENASAVLYLTPPGWLRLRIYKLGIPMLDLLYRDNQVWSRPEADISAYQALVYGLLPALFWWQNMGDAEAYALRDSLMFRGTEERIWVDRQSLLPLVHEFISPSGPVRVHYSVPAAVADGRIFPSRIAVVASSYSGLITIKKMAVDEGIRPEHFSWTSN